MKCTRDLGFVRLARIGHLDGNATWFLNLLGCYCRTVRALLGKIIHIVRRYYYYVGYYLGS